MKKIRLKLPLALLTLLAFVLSLSAVWAENFSNFALTTLTSTIGPSDTTLTVASTANFPGTAPFRLTIQDSATATPEIVMVTGISGNTYTITRNIEGTTATTHASGARVAQFVTAGVISNLATAATGALQATNNLSDLISSATARSNLGLVIGSNVEAWAASLDALAGKSFQGAGGKIQLSTGSPASGDCAQFDSSGNVIDAGGLCGRPSGSTIITCDGTNQTALFTSTLSVSGNYRFISSSPGNPCLSDAITFTGVNDYIEFAPGTYLEPSSVMDKIWQFSSSNTIFRGLNINGLSKAQTGIEFTTGTAQALGTTTIVGMGMPSVQATNQVTGLWFNSTTYERVEDVKFGVFSVHGDGICETSNGIGAVRGLYFINTGWADLGHFQWVGGASDGDNGAQFDLIQANTGTAGGVIQDFEVYYNQNIRRLFKRQSGDWTIKHVYAAPGSDFVPVSGQQIGLYNLNALDNAGGISGSLIIDSGHIDCSGFDTCVSNSGGVASVITNPGLIAVGATQAATRSATTCNGALSSANTIGFYSGTTGFGDTINGSRFYGFGIGAELQGQNDGVKNALFYDPLFEATELSSSSAKDGIEYSGNTIYTITPGNLAQSTGVIRGLNATNVKVFNNRLVEQGNTTHSNKFIDFTNAGATGFSALNVVDTPGLATTPITLGSSSVVDFGSGALLGVGQGGTGLSSLTSGGIPYASSATTIASSAALAANAVVVGGGAGVAPATSPMTVNPSTGATTGYLDTTSTQSGTSYTLASTDCGSTVQTSNSSTVTLTVPNNVAVGCQIQVVQNGTGQDVFSAASGASIQNAHSQTKSFGQYSSNRLEVISNPGGASAVWNLAGDTGN